MCLRLRLVLMLMLVLMLWWLRLLRLRLWLWLVVVLYLLLALLLRLHLLLNRSCILHWSLLAWLCSICLHLIARNLTLPIAGWSGHVRLVRIIRI